MHLGKTATSTAGKTEQGCGVVGVAIVYPSLELTELCICQDYKCFVVSRELRNTNVDKMSKCDSRRDQAER